MRIISGKYKGRTLHLPGNLPVRPTTDFAKTGLFNILENRYDFSKLTCLDLFAGTGSISFELISRGCRFVTCVDHNIHCIRFIQETCDSLHIENLSAVRGDVLRHLKKEQGRYDLIFADPPYDLDAGQSLHQLIFELNLLNVHGTFILEHASRVSYSHWDYFTEIRKYGNVAFSFFSNLVASPQTESES